MSASLPVIPSSRPEAGKSLGAGTIEEALGFQTRRERHAVWGKIRDAADDADALKTATVADLIV